jgi:hypothetical protein
MACQYCARGVVHLCERDVAVSPDERADRIYDEWVRFSTCMAMTDRIDYAVVILGIMGLLAVLDWFFYARTHYRGPTHEAWSVGGSFAAEDEVAIHEHRR